MGAQRIDRLVHWGILLVLLLNAVWILTVPSFPTLDGWTHANTARMLMEGPVDGIFCSNPGIVPNRVGHFLLGALQAVFPALMAERVLLALIILGLGTGAYALSRSFGGRSATILLILPFTVNFLLVLGFHNFLLGLALALWLAAWWITRPRMTWIAYALLTLASFLLFYTHTTALVLFYLLIGMHEFAVLFGLHGTVAAQATGKRWRRPLLFTLACLPAGLLFLKFNADQATAWGAVDRTANLRELFDLRSLVLLGDVESKFNYAMKLVLIGSMLLALYARSQRPTPLRPQFSDVPLLVGVLLLVLYFVLPDSSGYASYITVRLQLMALVLFVVWMAIQPIGRPATLAIATMVLLLQQARTNHYQKELAPLAEVRDHMLEAGDHLPEGSVVLPISTEGNWLLGHVSSLLAIDSKVALLDNYECGTGYFPLVWCPSLPEPLRMHLSGGDRCLGWLGPYIQQRTTPVIDRIVLIGYAKDNTSCGALNLRGVLNEHYRVGFANAYATVYELQR